MCPQVGYCGIEEEPRDTLEVIQDLIRPRERTKSEAEGELGDQEPLANNVRLEENPRSEGGIEDIIKDFFKEKGWKEVGVEVEGEGIKGELSVLEGL